MASREMFSAVQVYVQENGDEAVYSFTEPANGRSVIVNVSDEGMISVYGTLRNSRDGGGNATLTFPRERVLRLVSRG